MRRLTFGLVLLALAGCKRPADPEVEVVTQVVPALPIDHPATLLPPDAGSEGSFSGRVSVEQLRGMFPVALGDELDGGAVTWRFGNNEALQVLASSLGEADYLVSTEDNLEPSPVYLKLMGDAARDVCQRALNADLARADRAKRALLRHVDWTTTRASDPAGVDANLRYLKLRFHGVKVEVSDEATLKPLRAAFEAAVASAAGTNPANAAAVKEGWRAVCVALLTAPEFHLY